ncbi:MAG: YgiQ family radical SAM protein [Deltaproteobacteria bacterium]|nr:YgiQ family radical SAM protein [Deltaproteobacteria bacterium]
MTQHISTPTYLPTTREEMLALGWKDLDIILVTGDTYIDSPFVGHAIIGRVLLNGGYRVGIIAQPDIQSDRDIKRLGEPTLFWGVTSGCVDSMIANYTASGKRRKSDDMTPGGRNTRRPDRAVIVYSNLIRRNFKQTKPIILGGIEASLRRVSHYDAWSDSVRRSILFDAKADILVYGMGEQTISELASALKSNGDIHKIRGICYINKNIPEAVPEFPHSDIELPDHQMVSEDKEAFIRMFGIFYANMDPYTAKRLFQKQDTRYIVQNPPRFPPSDKALDQVYELPYSRNVHPYYQKDGRVPALETIQFSITTHRGCYGECRFCAIAVHQGRHVVSRSEASLVREASGFVSHPDFKGVISDVGGPTANMYGFECARKQRQGACRDQNCVFPVICKHLPVHHGRQIRLFKALREIPGIRKVFIGSGLRYDLVLHDKKAGKLYMEEILKHHVSGQLKIAPEHVENHILRLMGKPDRQSLEAFIRLFDKIKKQHALKAFLTYYLIAAYPGCTMTDMQKLGSFAVRKLHLLPEQIQIFTPSPSTYATLMYYTETDPFSGQGLFVEKRLREKVKQKDIIRRV